MVGSAAKPPEPWTIQRILRWTTEHFERKGVDSPRLTGELLLAHALSTTRVKLYMEFDRPLDPAELERYRGLVRQRAEGIPTQHLTGGREFYGRWFRLEAAGFAGSRAEAEGRSIQTEAAGFAGSRAEAEGRSIQTEAAGFAGSRAEAEGRSSQTTAWAFIPRQETELLVEACLAAIPGDGAGVNALDLCAGSGCVGVTLLAERAALQVTAVELSPQASQVALANAASLGVADRYQLLQGDLFAPLEAAARWPLIVSNPPYVATGDIAGLSVEVRDHDPRLALDGGADGLDVIRRIVEEGARRLAPGGLLALEIGDDQGPAVRTLLEGAGLREISIQKDYSGHDRLAFARR